MSLNIGDRVVVTEEYGRLAPDCEKIVGKSGVVTDIPRSGEVWYDVRLDEETDWDYTYLFEANELRPE